MIMSLLLLLLPLLMMLLLLLLMLLLLLLLSLFFFLVHKIAKVLKSNKENDAPRKMAPTAARSFTAHADDAHIVQFLQSAPQRPPEVPPRLAGLHSPISVQLRPSRLLAAADFLLRLSDWANIWTTPASLRLSRPEWAGWGPLELASPP